MLLESSLGIAVVWSLLAGLVWSPSSLGSGGSLSQLHLSFAAVLMPTVAIADPPFPVEAEPPAVAVVVSALQGAVIAAFGCIRERDRHHLCNENHAPRQSPPEVEVHCWPSRSLNWATGKLDHKLMGKIK